MSNKRLLWEYKNIMRIRELLWELLYESKDKYNMLLWESRWYYENQDDPSRKIFLKFYNAYKCQPDFGLTASAWDWAELIPACYIIRRPKTRGLVGQQWI